MKTSKTGSIFNSLLAPAPRYLMRLALIEQLANQLPEDIKIFLEIGPGMGDVSLFFSDYFPFSLGFLVDFSDECVNFLKNRVVGNQKLMVLQGDIFSLSQEVQYDLVLAFEVFEHIENDVTALQIVNNILKPSGYFLFSAPAFMKKWQVSDKYAGHYRRYERSEIISKFTASGFKIDRIWCYGFPITHITFPIRQIYYMLALRKSRLSKEEATKRSGIERSLVMKFKKIPFHILMKPFFFIQNVVKNTDIGDGFLVLAHKQSLSD